MDPAGLISAFTDDSAFSILFYLLAGLGLAISLDWAFGDPSNKRHPVAWTGRVIAFFVPKLKSGNEKAKGTAFAIGLTITLGLGVYLANLSLVFVLGAASVTIFAAVILKIAIAIRGMENHAMSILKSIERGDLDGARHSLSMIVRRDTRYLDGEHIISATIECISESTVDGISSPLFYYSIFGPAGAIAYRVVNTLDSMIGYRDQYYREIGWMAAKLDTLANYIPARITAYLMVLSATILHEDWKNSIRILARDRGKTFSKNAGYPMATMAGALRVRLEKIGNYSLGENQEAASLAKCKVAISIMKLTTVLFAFLVCLPLILFLHFAGWWMVLFKPLG